MGRGRGFATAVALALLISGCSSSSSSSGTLADETALDNTTADEGAGSRALPIQIQNHRGSMEGHTPRGLAGSGTGLFAGDNLNPRFPDGDGIQIWLTFEFPSGTPTPSRAVLSSQVLTVRGKPFDDLGALQAEPVRYDSFSPALFDLPPTGAAVTCDRVGDDGIDCDVTAAVVGAIDAGEHRAQFRLKFDIAGDNDGATDLAMFFLSDSNTNERGIFTLNLS
jgi:hypothetical protein